MSVIEIVLLAAGGLIFILSYLIPIKKEKDERNVGELAREEIQELVSREMNEVRSHVDDVVDEAVDYAMEKTERSLERLSNEKIMAVSEYSDTVLKEIHKNHEEVMFLYDMLNDKQKNIKSTVSQVSRTAKEAEETAREAEAVVQVVKKEAEAAAAEKILGGTPEQGNAKGNFHALKPQRVSGQQSGRMIGPEHSAAGHPDAAVERLARPAGGPEPFMDRPVYPESRPENSNDKILEMYRQGRSKVSIARALGLGVGEVKLVIDLYKGM